MKAATYGRGHSPKERYGRGPWRPAPRGESVEPPVFHAQKAPKPKPGGPYYIQGHKASDLEWRTYRMALRLGWTDGNITFQYSILGGRNPGGQVLDFVFSGWGQMVVIEVDGDYWHHHTRDQEDRDAQKYADILNYFRTPVTFAALSTGDLLTDEMAEANLLQVVGRGY